MKDLTLYKLTTMQGNTDDVKITAIREELVKQIPATEEDPTVKYIFAILDKIIKDNQELHDFGTSQWLNLGFFASTRHDFSDMIRNTVEKTLLDLDLNQIDIHNEESRHAAEAISKVLNIHFITFEEEKINNKYKEVLTKMDGYDIISGRNAKTANEEPEGDQTKLNNCT
jgi:hypothetical protein